jgi:hypothetical protein
MTMMARRQELWLWNMIVLLLLSGWKSKTTTVEVAVVALCVPPPARILASLTCPPTSKWPTKTRTTTTTQSDRNGVDVVVVSQTNNHQDETADNNNYNDNKNNDNINDDDAFLEYSIDSFLRGDYYSYYDRPNTLEEDEEGYAVAPLPGLSPSATVEQALQVLRKATTTTNDSSCQAATCFLRFCVPLRRRERWSPPLPSTFSFSSSPTRNNNTNKNRKPNATVWKELLRGSLTPTMFLRRLRASPDLSILLDWNKLDVTEGTIMSTGKEEDSALEDSVTVVNVAMYVDLDGTGTGSDKNKALKKRRIDSISTFTVNGSSPPPATTTTTPEMLQIQLNRVGGVWLIESIQHKPKNLFQNTVAAPHDEKGEPRPSKQ